MSPPPRLRDGARLSLLLAALLYAAGMIAEPLVHAAEQAKAVAEAEDTGREAPPLAQHDEICQFACQTVAAAGPFAPSLTSHVPATEGPVAASVASAVPAALGHLPTLPRDPPQA